MRARRQKLIENASSATDIIFLGGSATLDDIGQDAENEKNPIHI